MSDSNLESNSVYPVEAIKEVGDSLGIQNLSEESLSVLADDVEFRIKEIVQEAVKFMRHGKRSRLTLDDVNHALRVRSVEPVYGFNTSGGIKFNKIIHNNQELYYMQDKEIDLETFLSTPLPAAPADVSFTAHWLAVEGVQPAIPQNPIEIEIPEKFPLKKTKISSTQSRQSENQNNQGTEIEVKPLVKHVLSRELRVYFERVASALLSEDAALQEAAYESLHKDPGLQQLLPYFINYIIDKINESFSKLAIEKSLLKAMEMILLNNHFFVDPYLHQITPILLSCACINEIGNKAEKITNLTHFDIRNQACELVVKLSSKMEFNYPMLKPKIIKTFTKALMNQKYPGTIYGGIIGLALIDLKTVSTIILPNLKAIGNNLRRIEQKKKYDGVSNCTEILVDYLAKAAQSQSYDGSEEAVGYSELEEHVGYGKLSQSIIKSDFNNLIRIYLKSSSKSEKVPTEAQPSPVPVAPESDERSPKED